MRGRPVQGGASAVAGCLLAIVLGGCGSTAPNDQTGSFFRAHARQALRVEQSIRRVEAEIAALGPAPGGAQLTKLARAAQAADRRMDEVRSGWSVTESPEEEELTMIQQQLVESTNELRNAMAAVVAYAGNPTPGGLTPYRSHLKGAREQWNEGMTQLWFDVKSKNPPTI